MRKLFLFATVAAAGLFAGCSSTDDALSEGSNPAVENVDGDENVPIKIGIGNLANMTTRGTGTVGGVGTSSTAAFYSANKWQGQYINVFMFDQGTFTPTKEKTTDTEGMYENRKMVTPGSAENLITPGYGYGAPLNYPDATESVDTDGQGEAMNADASIKYYPLQGNYDFFGYRVDDAANAYETTGEPILDVLDANKWTVPFTIDGSQDLMTTKAMLTAEDKVKLKGSEDYYSAKAARKGVQPVLTFNHLLTRLQFNLFAGTAETAGYGKDYVVATYKPKATITDAEYDAYAAGSSNGVKAAADLWEDLDAGDGVHTAIAAVTITKVQYDDEDFRAADKALFEPATYTQGRDKERAIKIESIQVLSKNTGTMLVAWKDTDPAAKVVSYRMGVLEADSDPGAPWATTGTTGKYYWNSAEIVVPDDVYTALTNPAGYVNYNSLTAAQKAVAVPEYDVPAYKKITWDETQEGEHGLPAAEKTDWVWLSLKQRAAWIQNENVTPAAGDVKGYAEAKDDFDSKETAYETKQALIATDGALYTTLQEAIDAFTEAETTLNNAKSDLATKESNLKTAKANKATADAALAADPNNAEKQAAAEAAATAVTTAQTQYDDAVAAVESAQGPYDTARADRRVAQEAYDAALADYYAAKKAYDAAKILVDQLNPQTLMAATISQDVYEMLTAAGQDKYTAVTNEMNTDLSPLSPTAADVQDLNYSGATVTFNQKKDASNNEVGVKVGDALLVAPNQYAADGTVTGEPLKMKVKLSQKVPVNWNYPRTYEYKSQEYEVDIPLPTKKNTTTESAFMINNSYNVNIWVYGFSRIKIETVINEWKDGGEISVGNDD